MSTLRLVGKQFQGEMVDVKMFCREGAYITIRGEIPHKLVEPLHLAIRWGETPTDTPWGNYSETAKT